MNSFGSIFKVQIFGESHGTAVGVIVDGCPAGVPVSVVDFNFDLNRRKSGAKGTTKRREADVPELLSGIYRDKTTGSPITIIFRNKDTRSSDYNFRDIPRPGHADFVATKKYQAHNDDRGGGHFSGRITAALVAAGVIAKKILKNIKIEAQILEVGGSKNIEQAVNQAVANQDSIGGLIECRVKNLPIGLGEPFFDSLESVISHAVFSVPAIKGIEFGSGFGAAQMSGSQHNDVFIDEKGTTASNHTGGINGGISNGNELIFRTVVKPTSSISFPQKTYNFRNKKMETLEIKGRHDACIALRIPVVIEAATAIALADSFLIANSFDFRVSDR